MGVATTIRVEAGLGGSFREAVLALSPRLYWPMDDAFGSTVVSDLSDFERDGTVTVPSWGVMGPAPEGGTGTSVFSNNIQRTGATDTPSASGGTLMVAFNPDSSTDFACTLVGHLSDSVSGTSFGLYFEKVTTNVVHFYVGHTPDFGTGTNFISSAVLPDSHWYLAIATWDGSTSANGMQLHIFDMTTGITATVQGTSTVGSVAALTQFDVGYPQIFGPGFAGSVAHAAAFDDNLSSGQVTDLIEAMAWTDISDDLDASSPLRLKFGIDGNSPTDCTADIGELSFTLANYANNTGRPQGYYSPGHGSCRSNWFTGVPVRVIGTYFGDKTRFRGKVAAITPDAGQYRTQRVKVVAYDYAYDLANEGVRQVDLQVDQTEDTLFHEVLQALPFAARPVARDVSAGINTLPYVFDDVRNGTKAAGLIQATAQSVQGLAAFRGDGTFFYSTRRDREFFTEVVGEQDDTFHGLHVSTDRRQTYHLVRVGIHPRSVDAAATTVLWALTGVPPVIAPGASLTIWGAYRDPTDVSVPIGGLDRVTPLVSATDFVGNSAVDGSGTDLTTSLSVSVDDFASTAKFVATNNGAVPVYLTTLQIRGKGVYQRPGQYFEHGSTPRFGSGEFEFELPYEASADFAQAVAQYVENQYSVLSTQAHEVSLIANASDAMMNLAMNAEPGYTFILTETQTGFSSEVVIHSVALEVSTGPWVTCRLGLAPASPWNFWRIGSAGSSEIGETTRVGW